MSRKYKPQHIKRWMNHVAESGCCVCGSPANIHHIRPDAMPRHDLLIIPLCKYHHQDGQEGIHADVFGWQKLNGNVWNHYVETLDNYLRSFKR